MSSLPAVVQRVGPLRGGVRTLVGVDASGGMTSGGGGSYGTSGGVIVSCRHAASALHIAMRRRRAWNRAAAPGRSMTGTG
ncbi:hypothetical protein SORBI_3001G512633 [Sorghum bicolor]|uniref:Uncharacterized protein n=1 Tax=Sorghum bicolor TaxID=4558 RepID=A0A1Z5SBL7_SORBI|nr:hypothetical protein SORBI_3001G512633 [Sorghum bicolor]